MSADMQTLSTHDGVLHGSSNPGHPSRSSAAQETSQVPERQLPSELPSTQTSPSARGVCTGPLGEQASAVQGCLSSGMSPSSYEAESSPDVQRNSSQSPAG